MPLQSKLTPVYIPKRLAVWNFIQFQAVRFLDRTALVEWPSGDSLTFRQYLENVERVAAALWKLGVRKGDVALIFAPNTIKTPVVMNALLSIGAAFTACNPTYTAGEVLDHLSECRSKYIITTNTLLPVIKEVKRTRQRELNVILYGEKEPGLTSYKELVEYDGPSAPHVCIDSEDMTLLYFSSGTTGKPKGVMHSHRSLASVLLLMSHQDIFIFERETEEALVVFLPLFHGFGVVLTELMLSLGKTSIVMEYFDFESFLQLNAAHKCKTALIVPPIASLIANHSELGKHDLSNLKKIMCAAAPLGKELETIITKKLELSAVIQAYGLTECGMSHICGKRRKIGSVGILLPNTECKVVDLATSEELGAGKEGEILLKGPQSMKGYLNRLEASAEIQDKDGWFHTGDIGYYDQDEEFFITGRKEELIKYKGMQVAPASLEDVLVTHKAVQDAAIIGVPDELAGELPMAFIVLKPNCKASEEEIGQYVADRVAPFKKLRGGVRFIQEVPKSPSGKILRRVLIDSLRSNKL